MRDTSNIKEYKKGDWVLFWWKWKKGSAPELHEGQVLIIDRETIDVMCETGLYKHLDLSDVVEVMTIGFSGESCVLPPKWETRPGKIVEREKLREDRL